MTSTTFTVSGPGLDVPMRGASLGAATSRAITAAQIPRSNVPANFYVRDAKGDVLARVDRDERGDAKVFASPTRERNA